jgi:hypothetical protein
LFQKLPFAGEVPVIVLTAKEPTSEDGERLNGRVRGIMEKGAGAESAIKKVQGIIAKCLAVIRR